MSTDQIQQLLRSYNPSNQFAIAEQGERVFVGESPTLATLKGEMSYQNVKALIAMQVMDLDDEADVKDKLGGAKAAKLADKIYSVAFHLKASELMLFFWRFKCGLYGKFYGVVDSLTIMEALHEFLAWRNERVAAITRKMKKFADQKKEMELEEMRLKEQLVTAEQIRETRMRICYE